MGADQGLTRLFYDGGCGFCRRAVRFLARRDPSGLIRFAPLGGTTFVRVAGEGAKAGLSGSLVVLTPEGDLLIRSEAVIHLLRRLGGIWGLAGVVLARVPGVLRDAAYRLIARARVRGGACPIGAPDLDNRFDP